MGETGAAKTDASKPKETTGVVWVLLTVVIGRESPLVLSSKDDMAQMGS
jgi:hypothetical protein